MASRLDQSRPRRIVRWAAPLVAIVTVFALTAPAAEAAAPLPPLDHAAVLSAIQNATSAGLPAVLVAGIDESGRWSAAVGTSNIKTCAPAVPDAAFRIGSISKMFVAVAILKLVGEGKVGLDTPVSRYLPGLLKRGNVITIRMLLQHRAGLGVTPFPTVASVQRACKTDYDPVAVVKASDVQLFEPGTSFSYANAGYTALELVMEKVTGQSYEQVLRSRIVEPLGLNHTSFQDGTPVWPGPFLHGYDDFRPTANVTDDHLTDQTNCKMSIFGAAGSGISTTHDLTTFMHGLVHGLLLPPALYSQMIDGRSTDGFFPPNVKYGLGILIQIAPCGLTVIGHGGTVEGYSTGVLSTLDGTRTTADAESIGIGPAAMYDPFTAIYGNEYCGGS